MLLDGTTLQNRKSEFSQIVEDIIRLEGITQDEIAKRLDTTQASVSRWARGSVPKETHRHMLKAWRAALEASPPPTHALEQDDSKTVLRVMGMIGLNGMVTPGLDMVPPDGVMEIEIDLAVLPHATAYLVEGMANYPRIEDGDIVVGITSALTYEQPFGWWAIVQLDSGDRYYRRVRQGSRHGLYDLEAVNAPPIRDVELVSILKADFVVQRDSWRELDRMAKARYIRRRLKKNDGDHH